VTSKLGDDKAKWADEAKAIATGWETFAKDNKIALPDVGGGARDGGRRTGRCGGGAAERGEARRLGSRCPPERAEQRRPNER
jgi:hypothetical protein